MLHRGPAAAASEPVLIVTSVDIRRPPHEVWPLLVDWERLDRWMEEASDFRVIGDRVEGEGVVAEATIRIAGITTRDRIRVARWEPPRILEIEHLGWVRGRGHMELTPTEQGSHLHWSEELVPPWGVAGRIGMRLLRGIMRRRFQLDLERLRDLAEGRV